MNQQPIEKREYRTDGLLSVHSIFHTIQGEGPFCGTPAVFIRLAGCNLQCPACDTDYTTGRTENNVGEILHAVKSYTHKRRGLVVITGGEPFRQELTRLINRLLDEGYYVQVETNGTLPPPVAVPWNVIPDTRTGAYIVCSPKAGKANPETARLACCFKYVIQHDNVDPDDGLPITALEHSAHPKVARPPANWHRTIYVQPLDEKNAGRNDLNLKQAVESCMEHGYVLQLQIHKIINME